MKPVYLVLTAVLGFWVTRVSAQDPRADKPDSYYYYGPGGLWQTWNNPANKDAPAQRLGRDTWIHWTWGNQKTLRRASVLAGHLPVPVSIDLFRLLDSRKRKTRFRDLGMINEPNCEENTRPEYGLYLDTFKGDPLGYYPVDYNLDTGEAKQKYGDKYRLKYPDRDGDVDLRHFGKPSGIVGIRLFKNPLFDEAAKKRWSAEEYFRNPGKMEPPYLVGFSCAFCHIAFDPMNPPKDPENPRWENLAANIGNQYFREGEIMFGKGRILFGDRNPIKPTKPGEKPDPYQTHGLTENDFLYHYAVTQQPGTSETSRISYDFINNPNTINPIYGLRNRPTFEEHTPWGRKRSGPERVWHALKDGADAVGIDWTIMRVPLNIGCEGDYWIDRLFNPGSGRKQRPVRVPEMLAGLPAKDRADVEKSAGFKFEVTPERMQELKARFSSPWGKEEFGHDWQEAWRRRTSVAAYLLSYEPARLKDTSKDKETLKRGAELFGEHCARCHSSKQPVTDKDKKDPDFFKWSATMPLFLENNFLSDENRYPVTTLGTNMGRALATNAVDGDVWAEFSSPEYKAQRPLGRIVLDVPVFPPESPWSLRKPIRIEFEPPGGGRGYYRTPSLISMWATAPYLHNNAVGDYYVIKDDGTKEFFPNDGSRIGRRINETTWVDYQIDVSVEGRLKMFEDGMTKMLNPAKRRRWVKRTSADSALVPDLGGAIRQVIATVAGDVLERELRDWLKENRDLPVPADAILKAVDAAFDKAVRQDLADRESSLPLAWQLVRQHTRNHAGRLFELTFDNLLESVGKADKLTLAQLTKLKTTLRREFLEQMDERLDRKVQDAVMLKVPKGLPVNLYANLNSSALANTALAHIRYRNNPRALAEALLQMSDCPDLVEDAGHNYGAELSDKDKQALIEFLKTF